MKYTFSMSFTFPANSEEEARELLQMHLDENLDVKDASMYSLADVEGDEDDGDENSGK